MVTVAVDATPLLGRPTGVGEAVGGLLGHLPPDGPAVVGYGMTGTGWRHLPVLLPPGVRPSRGPMPAALLQRVWARVDSPPLQWWTGPIDVAHGTNFVVPPARRAARLVTVHDLTPVRYPELCTPAALRYPGLVAGALRAGASVHTPSQWVAGEVCEHFGVAPERVTVVPWGIEPAGIEPPGGDAPPATRPYVLALGTVEPRKDLPLLVTAFDLIAGEHPDLELRIAGPEGWAEEALRAAVAASPHRARVHRLGWVEDRRALLAGAAVLAYPSRYEGFGLPPLEAMSLGVPVVASAVGAVPEVVGDAADLVPPGDAGAFAAALAQAVDDAGHRARLVAAGRSRVTAFGWEAAGRAMADLYLALAATGGPPS